MHSSAMALASSAVRVLTEPLRTPPGAWPAPGLTVSRLLPMLENRSDISRFAPEPTANIMITAMTPIIIPSMVRAERILLTARALKEILDVSQREIMIARSFRLSKPFHPGR